MIILEEIKEITIFLGQNLGVFLKKIFIDLIFLIGTLLLIISFALVNKSVNGEMKVTLVFSFIILFFSQFFKKKVFWRNQLEINLSFTKYKAATAEDRFNPEEFEKLFWERNKLLKEKYKKISRKILLMNALSRNYFETIEEEELKKLKKKLIKNSKTEFLATVLLFLPFLMVLILYTLKADVSFQLFLLVIGLAFIFFIHSALIKPVFNLILQDKTDKILSQKKRG